jgi:hypothetical protein
VEEHLQDFRQAYLDKFASGELLAEERPSDIAMQHVSYLQGQINGLDTFLTLEAEEEAQEEILKEGEY